jgi:CRISPR-associated protein Csx3
MSESTETASPPSHSSRLAAQAGFGLLELRTATPLCFQLLPSGAIFAVRHAETLVNQLLCGPAEDGLFRLLLNWRGVGGAGGWSSLVGAGKAFATCGRSGAVWGTTPAPGLSCETRLELHPEKTAWAWRVSVHNETDDTVSFDLRLFQDLGLADEVAVRNNEAYTSHYLDLLPVGDDVTGWSVLARQNQAMAGGRHPWLAGTGAPRAAACCTDGTQFFGADHRLTGVPSAAEAAALPSRRLQYEFAGIGLQSSRVEVQAGSSGEVVFLFAFAADHPAVSQAGDASIFDGLHPIDWIAPANPPPTPKTTSVFVDAPWAHGRSALGLEWNAWFPGLRRHEERDGQGRLLSFFCAESTHAVAREKEEAIARPHGHILRSGSGLWIDEAQVGVTCYAAGIFGAQAYLGNTSLARLTSVVRNALNVVRAQGQRVFVRIDGSWRQLGLPTAFAMAPGEARWIYALPSSVLEVRVACAGDIPASALELRVLGGEPLEFLVTHQVLAGATEFEHPVDVHWRSEEKWVGCAPVAESLMTRLSGAGFAFAAGSPDDFAGVSGDGELYADGGDRGGPYVVFRSRLVMQCAVLTIGSFGGTAGLPAAVAQAREILGRGGFASRVPVSPVRLSRPNDAAVARIDEILPWFTHNAWIHFSAPHGLEQYGGAAWGVRDVCQGAVEWLLAAGEWTAVRRTLTTVFGQQYPDGTWPQWFMHPPYRFIQQAHSHGDVCFWPVKALCDYVEASGDLGFLATRCPFLDSTRFEPEDPPAGMIVHCDRVVDHAESRFLPGTALVNYGDGDWDDTLQPADPAMRTGMVSAWTVGLAFHTFRQLAAVFRQVGAVARAERVEGLLGRMRADFASRLMPGGVVAGFLVRENDRDRVLLHPEDHTTRIRHRLLPMTRSILAELFTPAEAQRHLGLIRESMLYPDGVRLMSEPARYHGGREQWFKRAETAANVGREIGLQYVHAHLRYLEALAKLGEGEALWAGFQVVNPVALEALLPNAARRQANCYFSSSDADFADRYEAERRWGELRDGRVAVRAGWRIYSSGPGLFLHKVRTCLLGIRESFGRIVFDPVLPHSLDGLRARVRLLDRDVGLLYRVRNGQSGPSTVLIGGVAVAGGEREPNPYRAGGLRFSATEIARRLHDGATEIEIHL